MRSLFKTLIMLVAIVMSFGYSVFLYAQDGTLANMNEATPVRSTSNPGGPGMDKFNATLNDSRAVIDEIMRNPSDSIPQSMLKAAKGLVIIPSMIKGSFVAGGAYGTGIFMTRQANGTWSRPSFISMTKGSVGFQVGFSSTDIVLVFVTQQSVEKFADGRLTLGVDASAAVGPVGRQAEAGTDITFSSEVYSYSRSRGVYLGAAIDGGVLTLDEEGTSRYYSSVGQNLPVSAVAIMQAINQYSDAVPNNSNAKPNNVNNNMTVQIVSPVQQNVALGPATVSTPALEALRPQISAAFNQLRPLLDPQWVSYLDISPEFYTPAGSPLPNINVVKKSLEHYKVIAGNDKYKNLYTRAEFQTMFQLLNQWVVIVAQQTQQTGTNPK